MSGIQLQMEYRGRETAICSMKMATSNSHLVPGYNWVNCTLHIECEPQMISQEASGMKWSCFRELR